MYPLLIGAALMAEILNDLFETIYAAGSSLTAVFLLWVYGPKLFRRFLWNLPKILPGWLMLPISTAASLFLGIVGLGFATFLHRLPSFSIQT